MLKMKNKFQSNGYQPFYLNDYLALTDMHAGTTSIGLTATLLIINPGVHKLNKQCWLLRLNDLLSVASCNPSSINSTAYIASSWQDERSI
jgi:hypothetical protein